MPLSKIEPKIIRLHIAWGTEYGRAPNLFCVSEEFAACNHITRTPCLIISESYMEWRLVREIIVCQKSASQVCRTLKICKFSFSE